LVERLSGKGPGFLGSIQAGHGACLAAFVPGL
jgi:hypothetical protein